MITEHPEYHDIVLSLRDDEPVETIDFSQAASVDNPFLHMGLHLALREQVGTDRPVGIKLLTRQLLVRYPGQGHHVEHLMMEKLALMLWQAQSSNKAPDEQEYLESLKHLI